MIFGTVHKYGDNVDQNKALEEYQAIISQSPYKEMELEYWNKREPIELSGSIHGDLTCTTTYCSYVENSNGEKFECTMSPSRRAKADLLEGNKYDFYETFGMTKYDATDKIKVVLYYYGEPVTIELEKVK